MSYKTDKDINVDYIKKLHKNMDSIVSNLNDIVGDIRDVLMSRVIEAETPRIERFFEECTEDALKLFKNEINEMTESGNYEKNLYPPSKISITLLKPYLSWFFKYGIVIPYEIETEDKIYSDKIEGAAYIDENLILNSDNPKKEGYIKSIEDSIRKSFMFFMEECNSARKKEI